MSQTVRLGLIGAGAFSTGRMLPGFQKLPSAEITVVANRSQASAERVAEQFGISGIATDYRDVLGRSDVDAVLVGTPPYLHKEVVLAALDAGKHVICQTRIATSAADAREMHQAAEAAKSRGVRTMLVPPAPFYRGGPFVAHLLASGYLGTLHQVQGFNMNAVFADPKTPLSAGRNDMSLYGRFNAGQLGLSYDVMTQWTGPATRVTAQRATFAHERPLTPDGPMGENPYPDAVAVLAETTSGAVMLNLLNYAAHFGETRVELYGSAGTVVYRQKGDVILGARAGDTELKPLAIPAEYDRSWLVEQEFIRLVQGEIQEPSFTFEDGVKNMEYLEAVYYAATEGRQVSLP